MGHNFTTIGKHAFLISAAALFIGGFYTSAMANDRMAGSGPKSPVPKQETVKEKDSDAPKAKRAPEDMPGTLDVNFKLLETEGYYAPNDSRALGIDLWMGTKRSELIKYLSASYDNLQYRSLLQLLKSALLTTADTTLLNNNERAKDGMDLTTLRLEKLLELGFYQEAATIYSRNHAEPYHERYARAGVYALMYSRQMPLACVETQVVMERFKSVTFWQQMEKICSVILLKNVPEKDRPDLGNVKLETKTLEKAVSNQKYIYKADSADDLKDLSPLTIAVLHADNRIDFSGFNISDAQKMPHHVVRLLLDSPTISEEARFRLNVESARRGLISVQELTDYYNTLGEDIVGSRETSLKAYANVGGWKRLPYLYFASGNVAKGEEMKTILTKAIQLEDEYGNAAIWPFLDIFKSLSPDSISDSMIRTGIRVFTHTITPIPDSWAERWIASHNNLPTTYDQLSATDYAALLNSDISLDKVLQPIDKEEEVEGNLSHQQHLTNIIYEKLDKSRKLHNYVPKIVYEKQEGLTPTDDYVMPLSGLLERLAESKKDKRLGETVLISSILLEPLKPSAIDGALLGQVLDSLITVGLTKEAQSLANEVMLGFE